MSKRGRRLRLSEERSAASGGIVENREPWETSTAGGNLPCLSGRSQVPPLSRPVQKGAW